MAESSLDAVTLYLDAEELFLDADRPCERISAHTLEFFLAEQLVERVTVNEVKRNGKIKPKSIWRATPLMYKTGFTLRGRSCSPGIKYAWSPVLEMFKIRYSVVTI